MADNPFPTVNSLGPQTDKTENPLYVDADYKPILSNWFTAKPYGFRFTPKSGSNNAKVMYLPIGPSNLNITTHFATNIIPTIYGTVEEHSPVRYYDISIEGTTGMTPKHVEPVDLNATLKPESGRKSFTVQQGLGTKIFGLFAKTLSTADKFVTDARNIAGRTASTGVLLDQTGYIAFHNLYRFLLQYKKDVSGVSSSKDPRADDAPPLVFFNYKDNNEYSVVIKNFTLRRDKENPMLYLYSISMRGYNLKEIRGTNSVSDVKGQEALLKDLGLNGIRGSTILSKVKDIASSARGILGSVANGYNQFGR